MRLPLLALFAAAALANAGCPGASAGPGRRGSLAVVAAVAGRVGVTERAGARPDVVLETPRAAIVVLPNDLHATVASHGGRRVELVGVLFVDPSAPPALWVSEVRATEHPAPAPPAAPLAREPADVSL